MLIGNSLEPTPAITEKIPKNHVSLKFEYINENVFTNHDEHLFEDFAGCSCSGNCLENTSKCSCLVTTENIIYSTDGRLHNVDPFTAQLRFLRECNRNCACDENICKNRLVQKGVTKQLIIFDTNTVKGLGVKAGEFIAKNSFVCEYTGDVRTFSNEEAVNADNVAPNNYETLQKNYILSVTECFQTSSSSLTANENFPNYRSIDSSTSSYEPLTKSVPTLTPQPCFVPNKCKTPPKTPLKILQTIVDATMRGNVGRLINHSCQPNLYMVPIRVETLVPRMCLFALMNINEGAELAYDYSGCPQVIGRAEGEASSLLVVVKKSKVGDGKNAKCGDDGDDDDDDDVKKCNSNNNYCRNKVKKDDDDHHHHHLSGGGDDDDAEDYLSGADNDDDDDDASSTETTMKRCFCNSKLCRKYLPFHSGKL